MEQAIAGTAWWRDYCSWPQICHSLWRGSSPGHSVKALAVPSYHRAERSLAEPCRLLQHRLEHWLKIAGRGIDDLQYLGGRCLLFQSLARLGDQPRVLHRDDRLR